MEKNSVSEFLGKYTYYVDYTKAVFGRTWRIEFFVFPLVSPEKVNAS